MRDPVRLHCYIDDYVAVLVRVEADTVFQNLCMLLNKLGLPLNMLKLTPPTKNVTCLGIAIDVNNSTLSIPQAKLHEIREECIKVSTRKYLTNINPLWASFPTFRNVCILQGFSSSIY